MSPFPPAREVVADVPCQQCGYNLRGLSTDGRCPECGIGVWLSLSAPPRLANAHGPWIRSIRRGALLLLAGYVALGCALAAVLFVRYPLQELISTLSVVVGILLIAIGGSIFGACEAYTLDIAPVARSMVQWSGWGIILVFVIMMIARDPLPVLAALCVAANQVSVVHYCGVLADRIPATRLALFRAAMVALLVCCWVGLPIASATRYRSIVPGLLTLTILVTAACLATLLTAMPKIGRVDAQPWTKPISSPVPSRK